MFCNMDSTLYTTRLHSYILTMKNQKETLRKQSYSPLQKKNKIPRNKPSKETKDLYAENYKTLLKEIKYDTNRLRDIYHVLGLEESIL